MFDFMAHTVILTSFIIVLVLAGFGCGYWISALVKWIKRKRHKNEDMEN